MSVLLHCEGLSKRFGGLQAVQQVGFSIARGEIYGLIGQGLSNKEIARTTALTVATVETHRKAIAQKLGVSGSELVRQASLRGRLNTVEG